MIGLGDILDFHPAILIGGLCALVALACIGIVKAEDAEMARFKDRCILSGETPAKCAILAEIKRSADDASLSASLAAGLAAGRR